MIFKKFIENIEKIYADQGNKPKGERLRYGQIIMNELWQVWPQKYHQITGSDKDTFYSDILHKKPYDLLNELEEAWPACPANPNKDQVRIQRLEKKIKKLQASNKRHKEDLIFYKRIVRDFPWIEPSVKTTQENIELKKTLKEKNWIIRGLQDALNVAGLISDNNLNQFKGLYEDFKVNGKVLDKYLTPAISGPRPLTNNNQTAARGSAASRGSLEFPMGECEMCGGAKRAEFTFTGEAMPRAMDCPMCVKGTAFSDNCPTSNNPEIQYRNVTRSELIGECIRSADEIRYLYALIDRTGKAWLRCVGVEWEGAIDAAMVAAVLEIERLRRKEERTAEMLKELLERLG